MSLRWYQVGEAVYTDKNAAAVEHGRPVVVIDPEDREQVERLRDDVEFAVAEGMGSYDAFSWALRQFANPKPPRPPEPQGLGAVVEAIHNNHFVHVGDGQWRRVGDEWGDGQCPYDAIAVVRVLSEGVVES